MTFPLHPFSFFVGMYQLIVPKWSEYSITPFLSLTHTSHTHTPITHLYHTMSNFTDSYITPIGRTQMVTSNRGGSGTGASSSSSTATAVVAGRGRPAGRRGRDDDNTDSGRHTPYENMLFLGHRNTASCQTYCQDILEDTLSNNQHLVCLSFSSYQRLSCLYFLSGICRITFKKCSSRSQR